MFDGENCIRIHYIIQSQGNNHATSDTRIIEIIFPS